MNKLAAVVLLLVIGSTSGYFSNDEKLEECAKKEGVTSNILISHPNDMKIKCFYHCYFEMTKVIVNGKVEIHGIKNSEPCLELKDSNKCELGFKLSNCLRTNLKEYEWRQFF